MHNVESGGRDELNDVGALFNSLPLASKFLGLPVYSIQLKTIMLPQATNFTNACSSISAVSGPTGASKTSVRVQTSRYSAIGAIVSVFLAFVYI